MTTITASQVLALGYDPVTKFLLPTADTISDLRQAAAQLERDNIPHAIVQSMTGKLALWRAPRAQLPTEHRRSKSRPPQARRPPRVGNAPASGAVPCAPARDTSTPSLPPRLCGSPSDIPPCAAPPSPSCAPQELIAQALRLAATGNRYAATQLRAFDTIVLTTAVQEWEPLGFRSEFIRLIETELRRRADLARIGQSHLCAA